MGKLHLYSALGTEEEEKGTFAKEIMSLIASVKKSLHVESFPNSDARSYVPDNYKGSVENPILQGEVDFEKVLAMHSQHHLSVCEVFESTCRLHKTTLGETQGAACVTTLRTETRTVDTVCATEETACQRKKSLAAGSSSEGLSDQRNKDIASDAVKIPSNGETEPLEINDKNRDFSRWRKRSQSSTSESSWCKLSISSSSSSWEELNGRSSEEPPREGQQKGKGSAEEQCCTTESEEAGQAADLRLLPPRALHPSPREPLRSCWGSPQPSFKVNSPPAGRLVEGASLCGEELREGRHGGKNSSEKKAGEVSNDVPSLSTPHSVPIRPGEEGREGSRSQSPFEWVHPEGEAADSTEDPSFETRPPRNGGNSVLLTKTARDSSVPDWLRTSAVVGNRSHKVPAADTQAETADDTEFDLISTGDFVNSYPMASVPKQRSTPGAPTALPSARRTSVTKHFECATTEEGDEKPQEMVSTKRHSGSSLSSRYKLAQSCPEGSLLNPRGSGFVFMPGRMTEEILNARFLRDDDYTRLLAGVEHNWLVQRLMPTGIFQSKQLRKAYCKSPHSHGHFRAATGTPTENSLCSTCFLLVFSFCSRCSPKILQEIRPLDRPRNSCVHRGLPGRGKGRQTEKRVLDTLPAPRRNPGKVPTNPISETKCATSGLIFVVIHLSHECGQLRIQPGQTLLFLLRYVGKEYKDDKGLLHHFSDVERQMTAQDYVMEFNKRLYEQKIPTQIFYIPSAVLLVRAVCRAMPRSGWEERLRPLLI